MNKKLFSTNLKKLRLKYELTQIEIAKQLGISERMYRKYENPNNPAIPYADKILKIAEIFNVSTDFLFGRTANPKINF